MTAEVFWADVWEGVKIQASEVPLMRQPSSFNPKPKAMAGAASGQSIPLPAIASGFGLNGIDRCSGVDIFYRRS